MPNLTPDGYRVLVMRTFQHTEKDLIPESADSMLKGYVMMTDMLMKFDRHKGIITVLDLRHLSVPLVRFTMTFFPKFIELSQVCRSVESSATSFHLNASYIRAKKI